VEGKEIKVFVIVLMGILMMGCATSAENRMNRCIGFHIERVIEEFGPPVMVTESQEGGYLYLWHREFTTQIGGGQSTTRRIGKTYYTDYTPPAEIPGSFTLSVWIDKNKIVKRYKVMRR